MDDRKSWHLNCIDLQISISKDFEKTISCTRVLYHKHKRSRSKHRKYYNSVSASFESYYYRLWGRDKQYRFHGGGGGREVTSTMNRNRRMCSLDRRRKWVIRVFVRTSADRSVRIRSDPRSLQHAINYANWSSGYRSGTRSCMLMCERTSVSPLRVFAPNTTVYYVRV